MNNDDWFWSFAYWAQVEHLRITLSLVACALALIGILAILGMVRGHRRIASACLVAVTALVIALAVMGVAGASPLRSCASDACSLPDPDRTPGVANPAVTQRNIRSTICKPGWTKTVRPPSNYTTALKRKQIAALGLEDKRLASYEEDHAIPLELGGHPTSPKNLWPQPYMGRCGARIKDVLERRLNRLVCAGKLTLIEAQAAVSAHWISSYQAMVLKTNKCGEAIP